MYLRRRRRAFRRTPSVRRGGVAAKLVRHTFGEATVVGSPRWRGAGEVRGGSRRKSSPWRARAEVLEVEHRTASCGGRGSHPFSWQQQQQRASASVICSLLQRICSTDPTAHRKKIAWTKSPRGQDLKFVVNTQFFYFVFSAQKLHKNFMDEFV